LDERDLAVREGDCRRHELTTRGGRRARGGGVLVTERLQVASLRGARR
jgi:hypothetical protein